ncbi:MAG: DUF4112 domain-containing protein [Arachnia sp.]
MDPQPTDALAAAQRQAEAELAPDRPAKATRALTYLLEDLVPIPGTKQRVGVDPLLSLIPGAGTVTGAVVGSVLLFDAARLRMPIPVLARMLGNWAIDWLVGLVPFVGPFLDAAWRSNAKNLKLLNRTIEDRGQVHRASVRYWITVGAILAVMVAVILLVPGLLIMWALRALA